MGNPTIVELRKTFSICKKGYLFCIHHKIENYQQIVEFFLDKKNSDLIERLPKQVKKEFQNLCNKYLQPLKDGLKAEELTIESISILEQLSQRTINVCVANGLDNLYKIVHSRNPKTGFQFLRNCGTLTNMELIRVCEKYSSLILTSDNTQNPYTGTFLNELEDNQNEHHINTNSTYEYNDKALIHFNEDIDLESLVEIEGLSARAYNVCRGADLISLKLIMEFYFHNNRKNFLCIRNCGSITNTELTNLCNKYKKDSICATLNSSSTIPQITVVEGYLKEINIKSLLAQSIKREITNTDNVQIFTILKVLLENNYFFKAKNEYEVFQLSFNCYHPLQILTLNQLALRLNLSRERVRQIREGILRKFYYVFKHLFPVAIPTEFFYPYVNLSGLNVMTISDENARLINQNEGTSFSSLFITYILSFLYNKELVYLGNISALFGSKCQSPSCVIHHLYLVNRSISSNFNLNKYLNYLSSFAFQRRQADVFIPFDKILTKFSTRSIDNINDILEVTQSIILNDLSSYATIQNTGILLFRNYKKNITQQVIEILRNSHKPLHYTEIFEHLLKTGIKVASEQSVHSLLNRKNNIFGLKGAGIFDLRSKGGYFGYIGDVAEQLLKERKQPMTLTEISDIICRELVVSKDSIMQVLFFYDNEKRFERDRYGKVKLKEWTR